jgi:hypothetical protein
LVERSDEKSDDLGVVWDPFKDDVITIAQDSAGFLRQLPTPLLATTLRDVIDDEGDTYALSFQNSSTDTARINFGLIKFLGQDLLLLVDFVICTLILLE